MLNDIVKLCSSYKTLIYSVKDTLLHQAPFSKSTRKKQAMKQLKSLNKSSGIPAGLSSNDSIGSGSSVAKLQHISITLNDVDTILESMLVLSGRATKVLLIINQVKKLAVLQPLVVGLPRAVAKKDEEGTEETSDEEESSDDGEEEDGDNETYEGVSSQVNDELTPSIAELVSGCIKNCMECLSRGCPLGSKEVFAFVGKEKAAFPLVYLKYEQLIEEFDETVSQYLMVSLHVE